MIRTIQIYYHNLETNNVDKMESVLSKNFYGIRVFTEEKFFDKEPFLQFVKLNCISKYEITQIKEYGTTITCHVTLHLESAEIIEVDTKFTFRDGFIDKVYETIKSPLKRIQCIVSYDGTNYSGFQKQLNAHSVQETIETSINESLQRKDIIIHPSGRTDKGVHAYNQVFHFDTDSTIPAEKFAKIVNNYLPNDIYIKSSKQVENTHHSRYDVVEKEYMYEINTKEYDVTKRNYQWFVPNLDIALFTKTIKQVLGTHDFTTFTTASTKSNFRTINRVEVQEDNGKLQVHLAGSGFLRYMVRYIIGASVHISQGKLPYTMKELIHKQDVNVLKDKAPAGGLYLYSVVY